LKPLGSGLELAGVVGIPSQGLSAIRSARRKDDLGETVEPFGLDGRRRPLGETPLHHVEVQCEVRDGRASPREGEIFRLPVLSHFAQGESQSGRRRRVAATAALRCPEPIEGLSKLAAVIGEPAQERDLRWVADATRLFAEGREIGCLDASGRLSMENRHDSGPRDVVAKTLELVRSGSALPPQGQQRLD
jgi:hypothetical protein